MAQFAPKQKRPRHKKSKKVDTPASIQRSEDELELIRHNLHDGNHTPESITALQSQYGNQFVLNMMNNQQNTQTNNSLQRSPITSAPTGVIQRGPLKALSKMLTFGSKSDRTAMPDDQNLNSNRFDHIDENVEIQSTDNVVLRGRYYFAHDQWKADGNATGKTVLFLSGSGGSSEKYSYDVAKAYCEQGADVLAVNYRGFGGSKKQYTNRRGRQKEKSVTPSEQGLYDDAQSMFRWLGTQGIAPGNVIVHGYSLGGAVAADLAAHLAEEGINIAGMVMHSPMPNTKDPAKDMAEDMLGSVSKSGARKLGKIVASWAEAPFDTTERFRRLAAVKPDFPVFFLSGSLVDGDHLALGHTGIDDTAQDQGLTNTQSSEVDGGHFDGGEHMANARNELEEWFQSLVGDEVEDVDQILENENVPDNALVEDV